MNAHQASLCAADRDEWREAVEAELDVFSLVYFLTLCRSRLDTMRVPSDDVTNLVTLLSIRLGKYHKVVTSTLVLNTLTRMPLWLECVPFNMS